MLIRPAHLPDGYLAAGFFPVLTCPDETDATMILPSQIWAKELIGAWSGQGDGENHFVIGKN